MSSSQKRRTKLRRVPYVLYDQVLKFRIDLSIYLFVRRPRIPVKASRYFGVLTSALDGGEWSVSRLGRFIHSEEKLGADWIGGWVGPRAFFDAAEKRNYPRLPGIDTQYPGRQA
jgi:hypothetical protein